MKLGTPLAILVSVAALGTRGVNAQKLYTISGRSGIHRMNLDGSESEFLVNTGNTYAGGIALDRQAGKMYWVENSANKIRRANLNGSEPEDLVATDIFPTGIALDLNVRKMYWTEGSRISRADLDGSNIEVLILRDTGLRYAAGLTLDLYHDRMYWISGGVIRSAGLDGSNAADTIFVSGYIQGFAIDPIAQKVVWTAWAFNPSVFRIQCSSLDGSNIQDIMTTDLVYPLGIALDLCERDGVFRPTDHFTFVDCFTGPGAVTTGDCYCADLSGDARVDLMDYSLLQRNFHELQKGGRHDRR